MLSKHEQRLHNNFRHRLANDCTIGAVRAALVFNISMGLPKALNVKKIKGTFWNIFIMIKEPLRPILTRLTYPLFQLDWCVILDSHLLNNITIKHNSVGIQYLLNRLRWSQKEGFFACPRSMLRFRFFFLVSFINLLATNSNVCESDNFSIISYVLLA